MRVLICPDRIGPLSSAQAGTVLAAGWPGAERCAVGEAGHGVLEALAEDWRVPLQSAMLDALPVEWVAAGEAAALAVSSAPAGPDGGIATGPIPYDASSAPLGRAISAVLDEVRPRRLLVDLAGVDVHDAGAGLLAALGARAAGRGELTGGVAALSRIQTVEVGAARDRLAGIELIGIVPTSQRQDQLLGLRGITSRRGRAVEEDPAVLLSTDAALQRLTDLVAAEHAAVPGSGACGGLGWTVLALGGRLLTGPEIGLAAARGPYDLVVTGCGVFDFASRGGGVVAAAAEVAARQLAPCIVIAGEVLIGAREMRTMGIEAAYPVHESSLDRSTGGDLTAEELASTVTRISRSWRW